MRQLRIDELKVVAIVVGRTATVTLDLLIASTSATPYEAKLSLLIPADAVVTGYALDVGGRLIPGQLLEQPRARNLYEAEVRKGIDPGLAEVSGNRFATRIFPVVAGQPRRFRVSFAAPFDPATGLVLPLARDAAIGKVEAEVYAYGTPEQYLTAGLAPPDAFADEWQAAYRAAKEVDDKQKAGARNERLTHVQRHDRRLRAGGVRHSPRARGRLSGADQRL